MESDLSNGHMIKSDGSGGIALIHSMNNGAGSGSGSGSGSSSSSGASATKDISHPPPPPPSRYESQKRRDWHTFGQYLKNHRPPLALAKCSGAHVLEFLRYLDQFGKTKVHVQGCPFFGHPHPPAPCGCPLRQAWGSLDALIGRLRAAYEEHGGKPESNPFGARAVRLFLRDVREHQAKARGIAYEKKKRRRPPLQQQQQQQLAQQNETSNAGQSQVQHQSNNVQTQHQIYQQQQHQQISHHQQLQATIQQFQQQQQQMHSHHHLGGHVISVAVSQFLSNDPNSVMLAAMPNHN